jgi:hypothetical protein
LSDPNGDPFPGRPIPTVGLDLNELDGAFWETFLIEVTDPEYHAAFRAFSTAANHIVLESRQRSPFDRYIDFTAYSLQAGLIDLRHLQHCFILFSEHTFSSEEDGDEQKRHRELLQLSVRIAKRIEKLADDLEKEVGNWKFEIEA